MIEIYEGVYRPKGGAQRVARHHFSGPLQQHRQNLKRLILEANLPAVLAQFGRVNVGLEHAKSNLASASVAMR